MDNYTLYIDGSYHQSTEKSVIAGILFKNGRMFDFFSIKTDNTNNDFEAFALLYGLEFSKKHTQNLNVISDCFGNMSLFNAYLEDPSLKKITKKREVYTEITKEIKNFKNITFTFTPRERNKIADFLSKSNDKESIAQEFEYIKNYEKTSSNPIFSELYHINKKLVHKNTKFNSLITLAEIATHKDKYILNFLHIDSKTGNYFFKSKKIKKTFEKIPEHIYKEIQSVDAKRRKLIINGAIAENIHYAIAGYNWHRRSLNKCFLELSPIWKDIKDINVLEKEGKKELKIILNNIQKTCQKSSIVIKDTYLDKFIHLVQQFKNKIYEKSLFFKNNKINSYQKNNPKI